MSARLAGRMAVLARELVGAEPTSLSATEWRFGSKGSLSVVVAGVGCGNWYDHEAGRGGDALGLVAHLRRTSMRDALAWAMEHLGERCREDVQSFPARSSARVQPKAAYGSDVGERRWSQDRASRLWREAVHAAGTPVQRYLAWRGLELPTDAPLRFHPGAWRNRTYGPSGAAMLALMTAPEGNEPIGLHVTYLRDDGGGKAGGERPKVMLGRAGIVRLVPDPLVALGLALAEGIETSLAVMQRTGWSPVWAATSAGAIARFPVLKGLECLTVFADADGPGMAAARECCGRWGAAGVEAHLLAPPVGDWDDALPRAGRVA